MSETDDMCECCNCGYKWTRGTNGGHLCADFLKKRVTELTAKLAEKERAGVVMKQAFDIASQVMRDERDTLRKQLAEARKNSEWRPISEAPKDGTKILGWSLEYGQRETFMRHYQKGSPGFAAFERGEGPSEVGWDWPEPKNNWSLTWKPTHWQPLPPAPSTE